MPSLSTDMTDYTAQDMWDVLECGVVDARG